MPQAIVLGCNSHDGYAMAQYLMYKAFETLCESPGPNDEASVTVLASKTQKCPSWATSTRVVAASREAALVCGGDLALLARGVEPPVHVRVDKERGLLVYWGPGSVFMAWRELDRLLEERGLLYTTPPLGREDILRYKPR